MFTPLAVPDGAARVAHLLAGLSVDLRPWVVNGVTRSARPCQQAPPAVLGVLQRMAMASAARQFPLGARSRAMLPLGIGTAPLRIGRALWAMSRSATACATQCAGPRPRDERASFGVYLHGGPHPILSPSPYFIGASLKGGKHHSDWRAFRLTTLAPTITAAPPRLPETGAWPQQA